MITLLFGKGSLKRSCSDYNFIRQGDKCVPAGPEPIPAGVCPADDPKQTFMGSSGFRRIPGNTCDASKGKEKDKPVEKSCANGKPATPICGSPRLMVSAAQPPEGEVVHGIVSKGEFFVGVVIDKLSSSSSHHLSRNIRTSRAHGYVISLCKKIRLTLCRQSSSAWQIIRYGSPRMKDTLGSISSPTRNSSRSTIINTAMTGPTS